MVLRDPYEMWANPCQLFISRVGDSTDTASNFACGIPALPAGSGPCVVTGAEPEVTDLWWSSAAILSGFFGVAGLNFRNSRYADGAFALHYNGTPFTSASGSARSG